MKHLIILLALILLPLKAHTQSGNTANQSKYQLDNSWKGSTNLFTVNADGQIQFKSPSGEAGSISIWTDIKHETSMSWDVDVKLDFQSTNSNNLRIYVHSSSQDSIYIQVGNNDRQVSLYEKKSTASSAKLLIGGRKSLLNEPYRFITVRLTIENDQTLTLYTKRSDESSFYKEGEYKMSSSPNTHKALLKFEMRYIKGRESIFLLDNINVYNSVTGLPDPPPVEEDDVIELEDLKLISDSELQFVFDRAVDITKAGCSIKDMGKVTITGYGANKSTVNTHLPKPLLDGVEYLITWSGLYDMEGKKIAEQTWNIVYEKDNDKPKPPTGEAGTVIINEVMANPNGLTALPQTEYVELKNNSSSQISLKDWRFVYDGKETVIDGNYVLQPNGYAVLSRTGRDIYVAPPSLSIQLAKFPSALSNTGNTLALLDSSGKLIDKFSYPAAKAGISWERSADGHYLCTDPKGGTPGAPNSKPDITGTTDNAEIKAGDIVFNEILPNPFSEGSEYIELYNRTNHPIALSKLAIATRKTGGGLTTYSLAGINKSIEGEGYAVLTAGKTGVTSYYNIENPNVIYEVKLPKLSNSSSNLLLVEMRNGGGVVDEITYSSSWHSSLINSQKGVALERIDPDKSTQDAENWTSASSIARYGTPGYRNSQFGKSKDNNKNTGISAPVFSNGQYEISYDLDKPGYGCRAFIYNTSGLKIAEISNNELAGMSGNILWNGKSLGGTALPTGIYIFYAELYHPNGSLKQFKTVFLIK